MKYVGCLCIALLILCCKKSPSQSSKDLEHLVIENRNVDVYLPPNHSTAQTYPVVYFDDGQVLQSWNMSALLDDLINKKIIKPIIAVGVHSTNRRMDDYIPYFDPTIPMDFGSYQPKAREYTEFLINKVFPEIENKYKASSERAIIGFSFGGLHAIWAGLNYPNHFKTSAGMSPSFWVNNFEIFNEANKSKPGQKIWFDIGTREWNYYVPFLLRSSLLYEKDIFYLEDKDGLHTDADWKKRIHNPLILFAGNTDFTKYTWRIDLEVIKSQATPGRYFLRLNPVVTYSNGFSNSASYNARFKLVNIPDGVVNADGSFVFNGTKDLEVLITYKNEERKFVVKYAEVESLKR